MVITFIPASLATLFPLCYGWWRASYAKVHYGSAAAQAWSLPWYGLSGIALIALVWLALCRIQRAHRVIKVYTKGITIQSIGGKKWKLPWNEITGVAEVKTAYRFLGIPLKQEYSARLFPVSGKPIKLDRQIPRLDELSARIKGKIYPRILREYRNGLNMGETLEFGPVRFNRITLSLQNRIFPQRKEAIPWEIVSRLEPCRGYLVAEINNKREVKIPVDQIPNIEILIQLIQEGVEK